MFRGATPRPKRRTISEDDLDELVQDKLTDLGFLAEFADGQGERLRFRTHCKNYAEEGDE